jgi:hypothetical protein
MLSMFPIEPVDYLIIGHVTQDMTPSGYKLGGTVSYSSLTAKAIGLRVGILTSCNPALKLPELEGIQIVVIPAEYSTTFENIQTPRGRIQFLHHCAEIIEPHHVPEIWRNTPIVHLGPVAQELSPNLARSFPNSFIGVTPQGWLRAWDETGRVHYSDWLEAAYILERVSAAVLSIEDINNREEIVEEMLSHLRVLAVTEGANGSRLFWNGDLRRFRPPIMKEVDPVGAGDIYAAAFFIRLSQTRDPWEAARFATQLGAISVTRKGLLGVPTLEEVESHLVEVITSQ